MRKICSFILLFWVATAWQVMAQEVQITGKVTDASTHEVLPGVNIVIKGTTKGVLSDINGAYSINAPIGSTLVFTFIGYKEIDLSVMKQGTLDCALQSEAKGIDEILVIGYGTVKKSDATGSVSVVGSNDFNKGNIASPEDLLTGKASGVVVTSNSGAPGEGSTIRIRGISSMNASSDPLVVIDGVPVQQNIGGAASSLSTINPDDIESFSILKDASSTAIYGSRGSAGVIIITTKHGGNEFKVNFSAMATVQSIPKEVGVMSGDQYRAMAKSQPMFSNVLSDTSYIGKANTDWQKSIYRTSVSQTYDLSFSGSIAKKVPYRVSLGFLDDPGVLKNTEYRRYSAGFSINPSFLNDRLKVSINVKYSNEFNNFNDQSAIADAVTYDPTLPIYNPHSVRGYTQWSAQLGGVANPVEQLNLTNNESVILRSIGNIQLDYSLPFLPDLHANLNMGYDYHFTDGHDNVPDSTSWVYSNGSWLGQRENYTETGKDQILTFNLNYSKELKAIKSKVDVMAGYEWTWNYQQNIDSSYNVIGGKVIKPATKPKEEYYLVSFMGRINYSLLNRYMLTFTIRDDGTSRFAPSNRWGIFPSGALAWKLNEESFLKQVDFISSLKLRASIGSTGQQNMGTNDYPYVPTYSYSYPGGYYPLGGNAYLPFVRPNGYDEPLKWEDEVTTNFALDYGFLRDRITGSFEIYNKNSTNLIENINGPEGTNFQEPVWTNIGSMTNKGYEFSIDVKVISTRDLTLQLGYNVSYNQNKITKLNFSNSANYYIPTGSMVEGTTSNYIEADKVGNPINSFQVLQQVYNQNGVPLEGTYVDRNGDGQINSADEYLYKKPDPDYTMGITGRLTYKDWDFSFSGRASIGNYVYNNVAEILTYYQNSASLNNSYCVNVSNSNSPATQWTTSQYNSDYWIQNASFFRMDNMTLGYTFRNIFHQNYSIHLGLTCQNVFVITKYNGLDPEVNGGMDNNFYPRPRNIMGGLNFNF